MTAYDHRHDDDEPIQRRTPPKLAKRGLRLRGCGKMPYRSYAEAYAVTTKINKRCFNKYKVRAYRCPICHQYHLAQRKDRVGRKVGWVNQ